MNIYGLGYGCQEIKNRTNSVCFFGKFTCSQKMLIKLFSVIFLYFLTLIYMVLYGTINVYGLGYGSQDTMNFNFFSSVLMGFSPLRVHCMGVLRAL